MPLRISAALSIRPTKRSYKRDARELSVQALRRSARRHAAGAVESRQRIDDPRDGIEIALEGIDVELLELRLEVHIERSPQSTSTPSQSKITRSVTDVVIAGLLLFGEGLTAVAMFASCSLSLVPCCSTWAQAISLHEGTMGCVCGEDVACETDMDRRRRRRAPVKRRSG